MSDTKQKNGKLIAVIILVLAIAGAGIFFLAQNGVAQSDKGTAEAGDQAEAIEPAKADRQPPFRPLPAPRCPLGLPPVEAVEQARQHQRLVA